MNRNLCRMAGLVIQMISVFFILAGLFLKGETIPGAVSPLCLAAGIVLLLIGIVFYRILKSEP